MTDICATRGSHRQRGVVLVVGLVLLLVLTLIGVGAMRSAVLEERMTNNTQDLQIAFQFAEAGLREGEALLQLPTLPTFNNTNGLYVYHPPTDADTRYVALWNDAGTQWRNATITGDAALGLAHAQYLIEQVQPPPPPAEPPLSCEAAAGGGAAGGGSLAADSEVQIRTATCYRITARAWGATGANNAEPMVILQSTFQR
ncbi:PilX N-terminal domain-containing pilus assembly protein [Fontimonas sp. SYSU GA230001]|uniref:pilus assembly PilX family protein n=1 Tax=Fontimonas sp. SYSU GA230001 TaxID=3142450 RepID=UPI0032B3895D